MLNSTPTLRVLLLAVPVCLLSAGCLGIGETRQSAAELAEAPDAAEDPASGAEAEPIVFSACSFSKHSVAYCSKDGEAVAEEEDVPVDCIDLVSGDLCLERTRLRTNHVGECTYYNTYDDVTYWPGVTCEEFWRLDRR